MVGAVGTLSRGVGGLPDAGDRVDLPGRVLLPVQPLVGPLPLQRQVLGRRVDPVADLHGGALRLGAAARGGPGPDQLAEPGGVRLGAGRVVNAEEAAAGLHVRLQARLLLGVEDVPSAGEEDDGVVAAELALVGEDRGVGAGLGDEAFLGGPGVADLLDRLDARVHVGRLGAGGPVEDQYAGLGAAWRGRQRHRCPAGLVGQRPRAGRPAGEHAGQQRARDHGRGRGAAGGSAGPCAGASWPRCPAWCAGSPMR